MDNPSMEKNKKSNPDAVGMGVVVSITVITLTCIVACAGIAITWIINAY